MTNWNRYPFLRSAAFGVFVLVARIVPAEGEGISQERKAPFRVLFI